MNIEFRVMNKGGTFPISNLDIPRSIFNIRFLIPYFSRCPERVTGEPSRFRPGRARKDFKGFTLPEVLIAAGLLALILSAVYSVLWSGLKAGDRAAATINIGAREALDLMAVDIRSTCFKPGVKEFRFHGSDHGRSGREDDSVSFCAVRETTAGEPAAVRVEYYLAKHPASGDKVLYRKTEPFHSGNTGMDAEHMPVAPYVQELDIRYYYAGAWHELWDDPESKPELVRIRLGMGTGGSGAERWFGADIAIP